MSAWWKTFIGTIICACIVGALFTYVPKAFGYTVCSDATGVSPRYACAPITSRHAAHRFRHGKMGNDHGKVLPRKLRHQLNHQYGRAVHARGLSDWWNGALTSNSCWFSGKDPYACVRDMGTHAGKYLTRAFNNTTRLAIHCAGEGVIGKFSFKSFVRGKWVRRAGWYGVAAYTGGCMTLHVWDKWWP